MPTFVSLVNWTDQGIKNFRDSVRRAQDYRGLVEKHGGQVRQLVWTLGEYDIVAVTDFPDDETATAVALQTGALGKIRTKTMKAFDLLSSRFPVQVEGGGESGSLRSDQPCGLTTGATGSLPTTGGVP
jgi:uncharacterized protein with GYD domain